MKHLNMIPTYTMCHKVNIGYLIFNMWGYKNVNKIA